MNSSNPSQVKSSNRDWSVCCYCGATDQPMVAKDVKIATRGYVWWLAAACVDASACAERLRSRDAHMEQRWIVTEAGLKALAEAQHVEVA